MKKLLCIFAALVASASAQVAVKTDIAGDAGKLVNGFHVPSGKTVGVDAGGTLDISAGTLTLAAGQIGWASVNKLGASLADLPTRNFSSLQNTPTTVSGYGITDSIVFSTGSISSTTGINATIQSALDGLATSSASGLVSADNLGVVTTLAQAIATAASSSGKWYYINVAGTLSGTNAPAVAVAIGGTLRSNGSSWVYFAPSDASELVRAFAISNIDRALPAARNLYDLSRAVSSYYIQASNGAAISDSNHTSTDYIPVPPGGNVTANYAFKVTSGVGIAFYDSGKTWISSLTANTAGSPIAVPANGRWMRATWANSAMIKDGLYVVSGTSLPTSFTRFDFMDTLGAKGLALDAQSETAGIQNVFDKDAVVSGQVVDNTGATSSNASFSITNYIPVKQGDTLTASVANGAYGSYGVVWYTITKTYFSSTGTSNVAASTPYTAPAGAAYARFTVVNTILANLVVVRSSSLPTYYTPFGERRREPPLKQASDSMFALMPAALNLVSPDKMTDGYALLSTTGAADAQAGYSITGYMPVTPSSTVVVSHNNQASPWGIGFYDQARNFVSGVAGGSITVGSGISVPAKAFYARYGCLTINKAVLMVCPGSSLPSSYLPSPGRQFYIPRRWEGLGVAAVGDSITDATGWKEYVAGFCKCTITFDDGVSGATMASLVSTIGSNLTTSDLCIVAAGTNDWNGNRPLGALGDATGAGTFYGDVRAMIATILTAKPGIRLAFTTPLYRTAASSANSNGVYLSEFADAIIAVCGTYGIPVLDLYRVSGFNSYTIGSYAGDGLHPNTAGYNAYSPMVARWAEGL